MKGEERREGGKEGGEMLKEDKGYGEGAGREDRSGGCVQSVNSREKSDS